MLSVTAIGNLAADPRSNDIRGNKVTNFTVLVNNKKGGQETTTALDCAVWGKQSEIASQYLTKGSKVAVTGTGAIETYEGQKGFGAKIGVQVNSFEMLGGKPKSRNDDF